MTNSKSGVDWTDDRIELLKKLYADGLSAGQIANEIGYPCTRNAVIGKVYRLGLQRQNAGTGINNGNAREAVIRRVIKRKRRQRQSTMQIEAPQPPVIEGERIEDNSALAQFNADIPFAVRRTLQELDSDTCRWPCGTPGDPGFFFCGLKPLGGLPYCNFHSRCAYSTPKPRKESAYVRINNRGQM